MRKFLVLLLTTLFPAAALACSLETGSPNQPPGFLGQIYSLVKTKELPDSTNGYIRWSGPVDEINRAILSGVRVTNQPNYYEIEVFATLTEAMRSHSPQTRYYIVISLDRSSPSFGQIVGVHNSFGHPLMSRSVTHCQKQTQVYRNVIAVVL